MALACFKSAAEASIPEAYCSLGYMTRNGLGCDKDLVLAAEYYMQAKTKEGSVNFESIVKSMSADDKATLGLKIKNNQSVIKDPKIAFELFQTAAETGHAPSLNHLGNCYMKGYGVEKNEAEALKNFTLAADGGYAGAHINLGIFHAKGALGFKVDNQKAIVCFEKAIELGRNDGYYFLGLVYERLDTKKAQECHEKGVSFNEPKSIFELAQFKKSGTAGDVDLEGAFELFKKAAAAGIHQAHLFLGEMYYSGKGAPKSETQAFKHYFIAAKQNDDTAQYVLGILYEYGEGIPKDIDIALKYYDLSAKQGNNLAMGAAKKLRELSNQI